jgi:hypothetical protein
MLSLPYAAFATALPVRVEAKHCDGHRDIDKKHTRDWRTGWNWQVSSLLKRCR